MNGFLELSQNLKATWIGSTAGSAGWGGAVEGKQHHHDTRIAKSQKEPLQRGNVREETLNPSRTSLPNLSVEERVSANPSRNLGGGLGGRRAGGNTRRPVIRETSGGVTKERGGRKPVELQRMQIEIDPVHPGGPP